MKRVSDVLIPHQWHLAKLNVTVNRSACYVAQLNTPKGALSSSCIPRTLRQSGFIAFQDFKEQNTVVTCDWAR